MFKYLTDLSNERSNVDHHVEVQEDTGDSDGRVRKNALSRLLVSDNLGLGIRELLGDEGRDVRLETTSTAAHDDQSDGEYGYSSVRFGDDGRQRGNDQETMPDQGN